MVKIESAVGASNRKNQKIVDEFLKLIEQVKYEIDNVEENPYRLQKLKNSLNVISKYPKEIKKGEDLKHFKGIGKGTIKRINEILQTGRLGEIKLPAEYSKYIDYIEKLETVFGIGRKLAYKYASEHNIKNVEELIKAHNRGKIKLTPQMITSIKYKDKYTVKIPRRKMNVVENVLHKALKNGSMNDDLHVVLCGSFRRLKKESNDIDVLVSSRTRGNQKELFDKYINQLKSMGFIIDDLTPDYNKMYMGYCTLDNGITVMRIDVKMFHESSYYTALMHFTGPWEFNQRMRLIAKNLGMKLNEYGLFSSDGKIKIDSEKDIFDALGLEFIPPENR